MNTARQARVEASDSSHYIDALEIVGTILLENRRILNGVLVWSRRPIDVARVSVPRSRWIGMIVGDLAATNHHVMREDATDSFVKAAPDRLVGNLEWCKRLGPSGTHVIECLLAEVECASRCVSLEIGPGPVAFDRVAPLWDLPLELYFRFGGRPRQQNLDAMARSFDVADIDEVGQ